MNRKKVILLIALFQAFLLGLTCVLFTMGAIKLTTFVIIIAVVSVATSLVTIVAIRKFPM